MQFGLLFDGDNLQVLSSSHDIFIFEILILLCFTIGTGMLIISFFGLPDSLINVQTLEKGYFPGFLYHPEQLVSSSGKKKLALCDSVWVA